MGARIYANKDATTFKSIPAKTFNWYQTDVAYDP